MRGMTMAGLAAVLAAGAANAATINLINVGGVDAGSPSAKAFQAAANFWAGMLTNNVTVNLQVGYSNLGANILGSTSTASSVYSVSSVVNAIKAGGNSKIDGYVKTSLTAAYGSGAVNMITPGYLNTTAQTGINNSTRVFDNNNSYNNLNIGVSSANAKALGLNTNAASIDATIKFSNTYAFDFNPTDGISANTIDFVGVAVHEIGHALGFISGTDDYDYFAYSKGPGYSSYASLNPNNDWWGYTLDLFRYNSNAKALGGAGAKTDWAPGDASYFSIANGAVYKGGYFSTGAYNGNGWQASHWRRGTTALGVMDPAVAYGQQDVVKALDLAALDAIGWNVSIDALAKYTWTYSTAQIGVASGLFSASTELALGGPSYNVAAVPEPANWALLIAGFGLAGGAMRRRRTVVAA